MNAQPLAFRLAYRSERAANPASFSCFGPRYASVGEARAAARSINPERVRQKLHPATCVFYVGKGAGHVRGWVPL